MANPTPHEKLSAAEEDFSAVIGALWKESATKVAAERALQEKEEQLRRVLRTAKLRWWQWDIPTGRLTWLAAPGRLFGQEEAPLDATQSELIARVYPEDLHAVEEAFSHALTGERALEIECRLLEPDGSLHWVRLAGEVALEQSGRAVSMQGTMQDIDAAKRAEAKARHFHEELEARVQQRTADFAKANQILRDEARKREEAEQRALQAKHAADLSNKAKSQFLANLSHELRTPMNAVLGFAQLLELDENDPAKRDNIEQILIGGRHLLGLINEILDISRVEAGRLDLALEPVDLQDLIGEVLALMQPLAAQQQVGLTLAHGDSPIPDVRADRHRLRQVLMNLLSNAVKYNREGGSVHVSCAAASSDELRITVRDTGIGILPQKMPRLFTAFERLDIADLGIQGAGLGLVLTKGLVEAMGGRIEVESEFGRGSAFSVVLPMATEAPGEGDVRTVLYIEDDPAFVHILERMLNRSSIKLVAAGNGVQGLRMASNQRLDAILLDYHLPDMQGHEVFRRLQRDPRTAGVPVVVVSGDPSPAHVQAQFESGAPRYLAKPFKGAELMAALDEALAFHPGGLSRS